MNMVKKLVCGVGFAAVALGAASAWAAGTLPAGYTEVEYIEGNGTDGRIVTDYVPTPNDDKIEAVVSFPTLDTTQRAIWCARASFNSSSWTLFVNNAKKFRFDYGNTVSQYADVGLATNLKYTVTAAGNQFSFTSATQTGSYTHAQAADFTAGGPVVLFSAYYNGTDQNKGDWGKQRLYSFKVWRSGELIHYFVPCKDSSDNPTMVDICDNPATMTREGTFTAGGEGHFYDDLPFGGLTILPIPEQKYPFGATPEPGFTITNTVNGANWTFAQGGVAPGGCPFEASYNRDGDVGTVTATGKAGSDYAGVTVSRSYTVSNELLVNGGFEEVIDYDSGNKVGLAGRWTPSNSYGNNACAYNSGYSPNQTTTFISGTYCAVIDVNRSLSQVFTNDVACVATLSWKCKHRNNLNSTKTMYYWVLIDGEVVYPEEATTGSDVRNRSVSGIVLTPGEHTLTFQGQSEGDVNQALFVDDVSLQVQSAPDLVILPIEDQVRTGSALTPSFVVSNTVSHATYEVGGGASSEFFDVTYVDNIASGFATATVTGKAGSIYEGETASRKFLVYDVYHVTAYSLAEEGDGLSWASPMSLPNAIATASAGDTIFLKAGTYTPTANIAISKPLVIRGGFAGTDNTTLDPDSPVSVFDANNAAAVTAIFNVTTATGVNRVNVFERIEVKNGYERGFLKTGSGSLVFRNCAFTSCGTTRASNYNGRGGSFTGTAQSTLTFENCTFARNAFTASQLNLGYGFGAYITTWKSVLIDDSLFVSNGLSSAMVNGGYNGSGRDGNYGVAFAANAAPLTVRNTAFRANIAGATTPAGCGTVVYISGNSSGSRFQNCVFAGNACEQCHNNGFQATAKAGVLTLAADSVSRTLEVENCTFAYNVFDGTFGAAGICAAKGALTVRNSIFFGAKGGVRRVCGKDLHVYSEATADVDYCLFEEDSGDCVTAASASILTMGEHNVFGDPLFTTPLSAITPYYITYTSGANTYTGYNLAAFDAVLATIDIHVSNTAAAFSRTIDTGDPSSPYANEPAPNGGVVNLGAYGNTAEAATSTFQGLPTLASGDISIAFADDTHPTVSCVLGGATPYNAYVLIEISDDDLSHGGAVSESFGLGGVQSGDTVTFTGNGYRTPGDTLYVRVTVTAPGQSAIVVNTSATVTGTLPAFVGHGGGASVIHVREGAAGLGNGSDWANAFDNVNDAMTCAAANSSKSEIWIAGTLVARATADQVTLTSTPLAIRGGFTGTEDSTAERAVGVYSTIDGSNSVFKSFNFKNAALVSFERLVFTHARLGNQYDKGGHILKDTSAGDVTLSDCRFEDNLAVGNNSNYGLACCFQGTTAATVSITNCVFAHNRADQGGSPGSINGRVIYAQTFKRLVIDDTLFVSNGCNLGNSPLGNIGGRDWGKGGVIYAYAAPLTMRNCELRANRGPIRGNTGGIVLLENASYPSAFTNCLFVGNANTYGETGDDYYSGGNKNPRGGTILVDYNSATGVCDLQNCTVAYNISDAKFCGAGVQVVKGKLTAHDTIIYGNKAGPSSLAYGDIQLWDDGSAELNYVRLTSESTFGESSGGAVVTTKNRYALSNVTYGDPTFVTPLSTFEGLIAQAAYTNYTKTGSINYSFQYQYFDNSAAGRGALIALDVHLRSKYGMYNNAGEFIKARGYLSDAIDAGDRNSPYANEPQPNGRRVNLGAYGNTPWASMSMSYGSVYYLR